MKWALIKATAGRWLLPTLMALAVAAIGISWWHGYTTGKIAERAAHQSALEAERAKQARLADELERIQAKGRAATREEVRYVDRAPDPSACLDVDVLDDRMHKALRWRRD